MPNNELYGDEDFLEPYHRYQPDEDEAHEDLVQRVFEYDRNAVKEALADGFITQQQLISKMVSLLNKARSEGKYPNV